MATNTSKYNRSLSEIADYERINIKGNSPDFHLKIVVVGDGAVGKTSLLVSYTQGKFPEDYVPTVFENYVTNVKGPGGKVVELALWDTAGQEEYSRLRPLSYADVGILLICYAVNNKISFQNVEEMWVPEVYHFCPGVPVMIVGLKSDLYACEDISDFVDPHVAEEVSTKLGALTHLQCSAKNQQNIHEVFNTAITAVLSDELKVRLKRWPRRKCSIL